MLVGGLGPGPPIPLKSGPGNYIIIDLVLTMLGTHKLTRTIMPPATLREWRTGGIKRSGKFDPD